MVVHEKETVHILSIEDRPEDRKLISQFLKCSRVRRNLHFAFDGQEAVQFLLQQGKFASAPRPDLILLDLSLPKFDGRDVLRLIKTNPRLKQIPVIIFSTSSDEQEILRMYQFHANAYFAKPHDIDAFEALMKTIEDHWLLGAELPPQRMSA